MKVACFFETSGIPRQTTRCHITEDLNPELISARYLIFPILGSNTEHLIFGKLQQVLANTVFYMLCYQLWQAV